MHYPTPVKTEILTPTPAPGPVFIKNPLPGPAPASAKIVDSFPESTPALRLRDQPLITGVNVYACCVSVRWFCSHHFLV